MSAQTYLLGSVTTLLSTELNSLTSSTSASAISSVGGTAGVYNNTYGGGGLGGYTLGQFELFLGSPAGTLTAGTAVQIWFLTEVDGTDYEDGSASIIPARRPDLIFPVRAVSTTQRIIIVNYMPPSNWYVLLNQQTGQTWSSAGNTLKVTPATYQVN